MGERERECIRRRARETERVHEEMSERKRHSEKGRVGEREMREGQRERRGGGLVLFLHMQL